MAKDKILIVWLIIVTVLDSLFFPELAFLLIISHMFYLFIKYKRPKSIFIQCLLLFTLYGFFLVNATILGLFYFDIVTIFKDIWYFTKPIIYLCYGAAIFYQVSDKTILMSLVYCSVLGGLIHVFPMIFTGDYFLLTIDELRDLHGQGSVVFGIAFVILYICKKQSYLTNYHFNTLFISLCIILFVTSSRLWGLVAIIGVFHLYRNGGLLNYYTYSVLLMGILYLSIPSENSEVVDAQRSSFIEKIAFSINEIKPKVFLLDSDIHNYWRGYETYMGVSKFEDSHMVNKLFGNGMAGNVDIDFGKRGRFDDVRIYSLTWLHNGYLTIIIKIGVIGLLLLFWSHIQIYKKILEKKNTYGIVLVKYLFTVIIVTTFLNGGFLNKYDSLYIYMLLGYYFTNFIKEEK